ncbi:MAG: NnrS family protein, partial [Rhodospirillaceae bacterium]|nr:NnrS family protein [Rhodospirillaceae bacterium]
MTSRLQEHIAACSIMNRIAGAKEPAAAPRSSGLAVLADGYRPFFLLAGVVATAWVPLWLLVRQGLAEPPDHLAANVWHGHEMVFGYAVAVLAGFLLTAGRVWTGLPTASGAHLAGLALLWLAGRVLLLADVAPAAAAAVDLAFLPALAATMAVPLLRARNRRNFVFLAVLAALFALNLLVHLGARGAAVWDSQHVFRVALDLFA